MIVTTGNDVVGYQIVGYVGVVRGIVVRATSFGQSLTGGFRQFVGGNIPEYIEVCERAREEAYEIMVEYAAELGADAVIGMRYDATEFMAGTTEVLAYGTAVKLEKLPKAPQ